ncbi:MAG: hypothetical protein ACXVEF_05935 [Polyangiales bacterium]
MKSDHAIMIRWGLPPPGRENRALEVLRGLGEWLVKLQAASRLAGFRQYGYETGPLHERVGFVIVEGSRDQVTALVGSKDYRDEIRRIALVTTNLSVDVLEASPVGERLETWDAAVREMRNNG